MRRLLCLKNFDGNIIEIAKMSIKQFKQRLEKMETYDSEVIGKLVLLGGKEENIRKQAQQMIAQEQEPNFVQLAEILKDGKSFRYR